MSGDGMLIFVPPCKTGDPSCRMMPSRDTKRIDALNIRNGPCCLKIRSQHVPPFWHGLLAHSFVLVWQLVPVNPDLHLQL
jgi:hypothetical protein